MTCPSVFALDDREIHGAPADDTVGQHLARCPRCAARATTRTALDQRFQARFRDPLWRRVQAAPPPRRRWWAAGMLVPALAAVALVIALRPDPYRGAKGVPGIRVDGRRAAQVFRFDDGAPARPGDELQLTVSATQAEQRYVLAGSVDGTGRFSPFYPASLDGHSVALPAQNQPLTPPIVLDAAPGPERIVIVRSTHALAVSVVAPLAEAAAKNQAPFVIPGEAGADVRWVTVQKAP